MCENCVYKKSYSEKNIDEHKKSIEEIKEVYRFINQQYLKNRDDLLSFIYSDSKL